MAGPSIAGPSIAGSSGEGSGEARGARRALAGVRSVAKVLFTRGLGGL